MGHDCIQLGNHFAQGRLRIKKPRLVVHEERVVGLWVRNVHTARLQVVSTQSCIVVRSLNLLGNQSDGFVLVALGPCGLEGRQKPRTLGSVFGCRFSDDAYRVGRASCNLKRLGKCGNHARVGVGLANSRRGKERCPFPPLKGRECSGKHWKNPVKVPACLGFHEVVALGRGIDVGRVQFTVSLHLLLQLLQLELGDALVAGDHLFVGVRDLLVQCVKACGHRALCLFLKDHLAKDLHILGFKGEELIHYTPLRMLSNKAIASVRKRSNTVSGLTLVRNRIVNLGTSGCPGS